MFAVLFLPVVMFAEIIVFDAAVGAADDVVVVPNACKSR
jgi:hypothetical protein